MPSQEREGICLFISLLSWCFFFWSVERGLGLISHLKSEWRCLGTSVGKEDPLVKPKREMGWGGRWAPIGRTRDHPPRQGAPTSVVLLAHPGQSQHGWTRVARDSSDTQPPPKTSPPQHVPSHGTSPSHGMSPSPWQDGADMGRRCFPCFSPLDYKDVSYSTQKCGLTGDQHNRSLWIFLFPLFFHRFSPACYLSQLMFVAQLATVAPQCSKKLLTQPSAQDPTR